MIHAHFNVRLGGATLPDRVGQPVADAGAAREAARVVARRLVLRHGGADLREAVMVVADPAGAVLLEMPFAEALYQPVEPVADPARRPARRPAAARADGPLRAMLAPVRRLAGAVGARVQAPRGP